MASKTRLAKGSDVACESEVQWETRNASKIHCVERRGMQVTGGVSQVMRR